MNHLEIIKLEPKNWEIWKEFRLDALKKHPESFGSSFEEEVKLSDHDFQELITRNHLFCILIDGVIVSGGGFYCLNHLKTKHRGIVWGMYTKPNFRSKGYGSLVLKTLIEHGKLYVSQLHLTCVNTNLNALHFYEKHGFKIYGLEPNALKIKNQYCDEYLMVLDLKLSL